MGLSSIRDREGCTGSNLVEVVHLDCDTPDDRECKNPGSRPPQLVVTRKGQLERDAESLDGHDGDGTDEGTDGNVHQGILVAMYWRDAVDHVEGETEDKEAVQHESCVQWDEQLSENGEGGTNLVGVRSPRSRRRC